MKEKELREHNTCDSCGQRIMAKGLPMFYVVTVERYGLDLEALQRQAGMEMILNSNVQLAQIMGANEDLANPIMEPIKLTICEGDCAYMGHNQFISLALEKQQESEKTTDE